jgi:hypothetical protein
MTISHRPHISGSDARKGLKILAAVERGEPLDVQGRCHIESLIPAVLTWCVLEIEAKRIDQLIDETLEEATALLDAHSS